MISRRRFLGSLSAASACSMAKPAMGLTSTAAPAHPQYQGVGVSKYVQIKVGTGGHGHTYPGASVPFGMVQLSPDTFNAGWDWCSGYNYSDNSIMGFSHTHLSGTGIGDMLDVLVMPGTGKVKINPSSRDTPERGYRSRFSHEHESAEPGYYSVFLRDSGVRAELSATARTGIHRYTFPQNDSSHFMVDFHHAYGGFDKVSEAVLWSKLKIVGDDTIVGSRSIGRWANGREIHFAMRFSKAFESFVILADDSPLLASEREANGKSLKCVVHYSTQEKEVILVKTGISGVSIEGAVKNLETETPDWDFDKVRSEAASLWESELSKIEVEGGTEKQKEIFYTSLYHCMLAPTLFDDVDGQYQGMDGTVHTLPKGEHNYSTFSLWDTYRAIHPLFTLIQPERVPRMVNCLVRMAHESSAGMPVWPLQAKETGCMTGYHSAVVIAEAIEKGFRGIDVVAAYSPMKQRAMIDDYQGLALYRKYGYIPCDLESESIGKGMDYAYDDWAVAHVARAAGQTDDSDKLIKRASNYKNFFDFTRGFIRPRLANGQWAEPFAPNEIGHSEQWRDYTESNAWQATFAVQHDPKGLTSLLGGTAKLSAKLDALFDADPSLPDDAPLDIAGLVGQYAHGNEPSHHIAYLYVYAGAPYKTQERVWSLLETMYDDQPDGIAGNEDCGQMSAWYVMSAMGFYAVDPVSSNYVFGTPIFDRVKITLAGGKQLLLEAKRSVPEAKYIKSASLNGVLLDRAWFKHKDIAEGGHLVFEMSTQPNYEFGREERTFPPSMST
jgi:predicted alpha-1,2-mannosidase